MKQQTKGIYRCSLDEILARTSLARSGFLVGIPGNTMVATASGTGDALAYAWSVRKPQSSGLHVAETKVS